jgi:integrase/recombinase XerD
MFIQTQNEMTIIRIHNFMKILFMNGAEIVMVSKLLRLNSNKITDIYTHVSTKNIQQIKSPFDDL